MVLKRSKHGFNTGNTIRKVLIKHKKLTDTIVSTDHNNREWLESRLDTLHASDIFQSTLIREEFSLLKKISDCDTALFDSTAQTLSLKKGGRREVWLELVSSIEALLCMQIQVNLVSVSVTLIDDSGSKTSPSALSSDHPNCATQKELHEEGGLWPRRLKFKCTNRGIQRKARERIHWSQEKKDCRDDENCNRIRTYEADLIYTQENLTTDESVLEVYSPKIGCKAKGIRNKQRRRGFNSLIEEGCRSGELRGNEAHCGGCQEYSRIEMAEDLVIAKGQKKKKQRLNKKQRKRKDQKEKKLIMSAEEFPPLGSSVSLERKTPLSWGVIKFKKKENVKLRKCEANVKLEQIQINPIYKELSDDIIGNDKQQNGDDKNKKFKKTKKPKHHKNNAEDLSSNIKKILKLPKAIAGNLSDFPQEVMNTPDLHALLLKEQLKDAFVMFTLHNPFQSSSSSVHRCIKGEELKRKKKPRKWDAHRREVVKPLLIKIKTTTAQPSNLHNRFSGCYTEGQTTPRCFAIRGSESDDAGCASIIFQRLSDKSPCVAQENHQNVMFDYYLVYLRAFVNTNGELIVRNAMHAAISIHLLYPVAKIVALFLQNLALLPPHQYKHRLQEKQVQPSTKTSTTYEIFLDWIYSCLPWKVQLIPESEALAAVTEKVKPSDCNRSSKLPPLTPRSDSSVHQCVLCGAGPFYRDISQSGLTALYHDGLFQGALRANSVTKCVDAVGDFVSRILLTLTPCQHMFCQGCLRQYIGNKYKQKEAALLCPYPNCCVRLGDVLEQLCMPKAMYKQQKLRQLHDVLESHPLLRSCPSKKCKMAARLDGSSFVHRAVMVLCQCGGCWCFDCRKEAHWPAACGHLDSAACIIKSCRRYICHDCSEGKTSCSCVLGISISSATSQPLNQLIPLPNVRHDLLSMIYDERAEGQKCERRAWCAAEAEINAIQLSHLITKAKMNLSNPVILSPSSPLSHLPRNILPPKTLKPIKMKQMKNANTQTDRFVLLFAQHFIFKANCLLENVNIALSSLVHHCDQESLREIESRVQSILSTQRAIQATLSNWKEKPSAVLPRIQELLLEGEVSLTSLVHHMHNCKVTSRPSSFSLRLLSL